MDSPTTHWEYTHRMLDQACAALDGNDPRMWHKVLTTILENADSDGPKLPGQDEIVRYAAVFCPEAIMLHASSLHRLLRQVPLSMIEQVQA